MRIALTPSPGRLETLDELLRDAGHDPVRTPLVTTTPNLDHAAAMGLLDLPWRVYPSRSAVTAWNALGLGFDDGARIGAVGPGTTRDLETAGARVDLTARRATGETLARELLTHPQAPRRGEVVGVVQGDRARTALRAVLEAAGVRVRTATLYETRQLAWDVREEVDAVVLASPSAVASLPESIGRRALLIAIGPTTARAIRRRGWNVIQAAHPTAQAVAAVIAQHGTPGAGPDHSKGVPQGDARENAP